MKSPLLITVFFLILASPLCGQVWRDRPEKIRLKDIRWRDNCVLADKASGYYYMVGPAGQSVLSYRSRDLLHWEQPAVLFTIPEKFWGDMEPVSIWAPELHLRDGRPGDALRVVKELR